MRPTVAFAAAVLSACGHHASLKTGSVVEKKYQPPWTETVQIPQYTTICTPIGKTESCMEQLIGFLPITTDHREEWQLKVRGFVGDKQHIQTVTTDQTSWERARIGDSWEKSR